MSIYQEIEEATHKVGRSTRNKRNMASSLKKMVHFCRHQANIQLRSFKTLKVRYVHVYIQHQLQNQVTTRSLVNEMSHLRQILRSVGRVEFANSKEMSNSELRLSGASRAGTHRALTHSQFRAVHAAATASHPGASCCLELMRFLGLRACEAVQCVKSLEHWLTKLCAGESILIIHGTKGGKTRYARPVNQDRAILAVRTALRVVEAQGGRLITSRSLSSAMSYFRSVCASIGMKGEYASHALRCTYARERYLQLYQELKSESEAVAALSLELGHGSSRGTYIKKVYLFREPRDL